jgi:hypothetical protein
VTFTLEGVASLITSVATLVYVIRMDRKVEVVHKATNSLVVGLVKSAKREGHAEGLAEGHAEGLAEGLEEGRHE